MIEVKNVEKILADQGFIISSVKGDSMLPMLDETKDAVKIVSASEELEKYDLPLYIRDDGHFVLHRIVAVKGDVYTCIGDNQFVYEKGVRRDQMIGVVTSFCRDGKRIDTSKMSHRVYRVLWHRSRCIRRVWRAAGIKFKRLFKK